MKLHFRKTGNGKPLIILHGLFGLSDNWQTLGKKYAEHFTVYMVDLRNHGNSAHSEIWNYDVMADDILEMMDEEGIEKADVIGHSMGGKTAMFFAVKYPERINKLIVADIAPGRHEFNQHDVIEALNAVNLDVVSSRKEVEEILNLYINSVGVKQFLLKNLYWDDYEKLAWKFNLDVISRNIDKIGEQVPEKRTNLPVMFIRGGKSDYIKKEDEELIFSIFPESIIKTIEGAGHWLHAEKPADFFQVSLSFLQ